MASPKIITPAGTYRYNGEEVFHRLIREEQAAVDAKFKAAKDSGEMIDLTKEFYRPSSPSWAPDKPKPMSSQRPTSPTYSPSEPMSSSQVPVVGFIQDAPKDIQDLYYKAFPEKKRTVADLFEDSDDSDEELSEAEVAALPKERQDYLKSLEASGHKDVYHRGNQTEDEEDEDWDPMDGDANRKRIQAESARVNRIIQQLQASSPQVAVIPAAQVQEVPVAQAASMGAMPAQVISSSSLVTSADWAQVPVGSSSLGSSADHPVAQVPEEDVVTAADVQTKALESHSDEWYKRKLAEVNQGVVGATFGGGRLPNGRSMRIRTKRRRLTYTGWGAEHKEVTEF